MVQNALKDQRHAAEAERMVQNALKDLTDWFTMEVIAEGARVVIQINDKKVVDYRLPAGYRKRGHLALQHYTPQTVVEFSRIEVKELPGERANEDKGFVALFNGKDLTGWKTHLRQPGNWRVEKGVLIGSGPATSHLYTKRRAYKNFHLRVEARINAGGNSGVLFRAGFGPVFPAENPLGYEAQIANSKPGDPAQTGSLYAVTGRPGSGGPVVSVHESLVRSGEWFTQEVIAEGNHIVIKVNGKTTADYTDEKRCFTSGHIALQQHNAQTVAEFRKIEIKELPPTERRGR
jgi:hypothetical protein